MRMRIKTIQTSNKNFILKYFRCRDAETRIGMEGICISHLCFVFSKAIFLWFATFYVFNLHYEKSTKEVPLFFQEYVFGHPDPCKKTSTYLSVSTDIQRNIETSA